MIIETLAVLAALGLLATSVAVAFVTTALAGRLLNAAGNLLVLFTAVLVEAHEQTRRAIRHGGRC